MTPDHSPRNRSVAAVGNPSARALTASLGLVVLGPVLAMVVYTHPMLGLGGLAGLLARPSLGLTRRILRDVSEFLGHDERQPRLWRRESSPEASLE